MKSADTADNNVDKAGRNFTEIAVRTQRMNCFDLTVAMEKFRFTKKTYFSVRSSGRATSILLCLIYCQSTVRIFISRDEEN